MQTSGKRKQYTPEDFVARQPVCAFIETALPGAFEKLDRPPAPQDTCMHDLGPRTWRCAVCGARCAVCGEEILAVRKLHRMPRRVRASRPTRAFICSRPGFRGFLGVHMSPRWWLKRSATGAMTFPLTRPVSGDAQFLRKGVSHSRIFQQFRAKLHSFLST